MSMVPMSVPPGVVTVDGPELHADLRALVDAGNFAAVSTLLPGGQPQTQVTWVDVDTEHLLINTLPFTQKFRNARRDGRVTVLVWDQHDAEQYVEVRGRVVDIVTGGAAVEHAEQLARRYLGGPYLGPRQRVVLRIQPLRQVIRHR